MARVLLKPRLRGDCSGFAWIVILGAVWLGENPALSQELGDLPQPPEAIAQLLRDSNVQFDFYREKLPEQIYDGETKFKISVDYRIRFSTLPQRSVKPLQTVQVAFTSLQVDVENSLRLPQKLVSDAFWESKLVRHEIDHLRVNTHPRVKALANELIRSIRIIELPLVPANQISMEMIHEIIDPKISQSIDSVTRIVQANNDLLDQVTVHGVKSFEGDPNFFERLYLETNLREQGLESIDLVRTLIRGRRYLQLKGTEL